MRRAPRVSSARYHVRRSRLSRARLGCRRVVAGSDGMSQLRSSRSRTRRRPRRGDGLAAGDRLVELAGVSRLDVPLPARAVGVGNPGLRLLGVAADGVLDAGRLEAGPAQAPFRRRDLLGRLHLDAEVVERRPLLTLEEDQFQRRIGDGEVRVAGLHLRRGRAEQAGVEGYRLVEVGHVDGELYSRHDVLLTSCGRPCRHDGCSAPSDPVTARGRCSERRLTLRRRARPVAPAIGHPLYQRPRRGLDAAGHGLVTCVPVA